ncbi:hypothetical protein [Actinoplanes aureus]|uniref:Secreted protein n=1 Tax=Actinoplanes aureus TaxID=2792083 RepID=A0A931C7B1_9ACTN|nr:hypothetical protein [Actinoplanes aureus]MBG0562296.1 hypothetical protein [Actinoplanes aureus]
MPVVSSKAHRRAATLVAASVAVLFTTACGGGSDSGSTSNASSAFASYISCLNENGVTITMPSGGPGGGARPSGQPRPDNSGGPRGGGFPGGGGFGKPADVDDATWEKAQSACASLRPSMGAGLGNRGDNGANAAYTNCLKENGVTDTTNLDTTDATLQKAVETCAVLKPAATAAAS